MLSLLALGSALGRMDRRRFGIDLVVTRRGVVVVFRSRWLLWQIHGAMLRRNLRKSAGPTAEFCRESRLAESGFHELGECVHGVLARTVLG